MGYVAKILLSSNKSTGDLIYTRPEDLTKLFIWIFQLNANALNYSNFIQVGVEDRINWDYFAKQRLV
jgi:hypothetical protein